MGKDICEENKFNEESETLAKEEATLTSEKS